MRRVNTLIGSPIERVEDLRFVQGRGQFVADLNRPGQWHAAIVRSRSSTVSRVHERRSASTRTV